MKKYLQTTHQNCDEILHRMVKFCVAVSILAVEAVSKLLKAQFLQELFLLCFRRNICPLVPTLDASLHSAETN